MLNSRRREERIAVRLPIRVWGMDANGKPFSQNTSTLDVTRSGARLGTLQCQLQQGDIIGIQHGTEKARFKVAWVGRPGTARQGQVGVICVEAEKYIWGQPLSSLKAKAAPVAPTTVGPAPSETWRASANATTPKKSERRESIRYACTGGAEFRNVEGGFKNWGTVSDVSDSGCYLETMFPLPALSQMEVLISVKNVEVRGRAVVRSAHPNVGMGIEFSQLSAEDRHRLNTLISMLAIVPGGPQRPAAATPGKELLGPSQPSQVPAVRAPLAAAAKTPSLSDRIYETCAMLKDAEHVLETSTSEVEPRAISELLRAIEEARETVAAVQNAMETQEGPGQFDFRAEREAARVRTATALVRELAVDVDATLLVMGSPGFEGLLNAVAILHRKLTALTEGRRGNTNDPISPS